MDTPPNGQVAGAVVSSEANVNVPLKPEVASLELRTARTRAPTLNKWLPCTTDV